jgi:hypothetical protein
MSTPTSDPTPPAPPAPAGIRAYVNERGVSVPAGATAMDALAAYDAAHGTDEAPAVREGRRRITDSRGLPCPPEATLAGGSILRVVAARAPRGGADEASGAEA